MNDDKKSSSVISDPVELFEGRNGKGRFESGHVANPKGRPRGSRNKLTEAFLTDLNELWQEQGPAVLRRAAFESPIKFADMVARLLPAKIEVRDSSPIEDMEYDRIKQCLALLNELQLQQRLLAETVPLIDVTPKQEPDDAA